MSIFSKKKGKKEENVSEIPKLEGPEFPSFPELPRETTDESMFQMPPIQLKSIPMLPQRQQQMEMPSIRPMVEEIKYAGIENKFREPIFVKIEKFRDALNILESIKNKLKESSELLESIRETQRKENEEIDKWAREIEDLKDKVMIVDKKLFDKVEQ